MGVHFVQLGDETLIDLRNDSVTPETLAEGVTAHDKNGNQITGTMSLLNNHDITLGVHTDGLLYIFIDGVPTGNGVSMPDKVGDVYGNVDSGNNIVLQGALADGTYSVKYEMENGDTVNIGNLVLDTNVYYSVTKSLSYCSIDNSATSVIEGEPYSATITANEGYELKSITVTMGGANVTVTNGVINIASVTGDIVITAVAEEVEVPTSRLPEAYQEVEWVQIMNDEKADVWSGVHTNVPWNTANKIVAKLQNITSTNANDIIFSAWSSVSLKSTPYIATRTSKATNLFGAQSGLTSYSVQPNNIATNNTEVNELTFEFAATSTADIYFGGWYDETFSHPHKWYSVEIYNGNTLLAHFIPCYRKADNLNGFYDLVGGEFYENADPTMTFVNRGNEV